MPFLENPRDRAWRAPGYGVAGQTRLGDSAAAGEAVTETQLRGWVHPSPVYSMGSFQEDESPRPQASHRELLKAPKPGPQDVWPVPETQQKKQIKRWSEEWDWGWGGRGRGTAPVS